MILLLPLLSNPEKSLNCSANWIKLLDLGFGSPRPMQLYHAVQKNVPLQCFEHCSVARRYVLFYSSLTEIIHDSLEAHIKQFGRFHSFGSALWGWLNLFCVNLTLFILMKSLFVISVEWDYCIEFVSKHHDVLECSETQSPSWWSSPFVSPPEPELTFKWYFKTPFFLLPWYLFF